MSGANRDNHEILSQKEIDELLEAITYRGNHYGSTTGISSKDKSFTESRVQKNSEKKEKGYITINDD